MHPDYKDIRSRIASRPLWFDENAVPRYCAFEPQESVSVYVSEIALAKIACQACHREFRVAISRVNFPEKTIAEAIMDGTIEYGDPPNISCCAAGPTMTSETIAILEYWKRHHEDYLGKYKNIKDTRYFDWRRESSKEIKFFIKEP